jgi:hypothetical protein
VGGIYFVFVEKEEFERYAPKSFGDLVKNFKKYKITNPGQQNMARPDKSSSGRGSSLWDLDG